MSRRWLSAFESDLPRLVRDLETLVRLESPSDDPARVSEAAGWVRDRLRERGVPAELRPCPPRGDALLASVAYREGGTLLLGHLDTVWPLGTVGAVVTAAVGWPLAATCLGLAALAPAAVYAMRAWRKCGGSPSLLHAAVYYVVFFTARSIGTFSGHGCSEMKPGDAAAGE